MYGRRRENVHIDQLSLFNEAKLVDESSRPGEVKDIDIPEKPRPLLKGSMASSSFVVNTAYKKLVMGVPFYRQEKDLNHNGIPVSRQVLCNWFMRSAEKYLKPVFDRMETDGTVLLQIRQIP